MHDKYYCKLPIKVCTINIIYVSPIISFEGFVRSYF